MAEATRGNAALLQLIPAALLTILSLGAAIALQPLEPFWANAAWVAFFAFLAWTVWALWKERPSKRAR